MSSNGNTPSHDMRPANTALAASVTASAERLPYGIRRRGYHSILLRLKHMLDWHFVKDSVIVGVGSTTARVLGLLFATLVARYLTPTDFSAFRYVMTLVSIVTIASSAYPTSLARFLAANPHDLDVRDSYFSNGVVGMIIVLVVSLALASPLLWFLHVLNIGTICCIVGLVFFYSFLGVMRGLRSAWKIGLTYLLSNITLMLGLIVVIALLRQRTATTALLVTSLSNTLPLLLLGILSPIALRFHLRCISKARLLQLTRFALPIIITTGVYTIWYGIDMLVVQNMIPRAAGSYAVAKTLSGAFVFVPATITMILMPRVASLTVEKSKRYGIGAAVIALVLSLLGIAIVYTWGYQLIVFAFSARYRDAYIPLLILGIGMSIFSVYSILESFVIGQGRPGLIVRALATALIGTGATIFWSISRWGAIGASLSFSFGAALGTAVMILNTWLFFRREHRMSSPPSLPPDAEDTQPMSSSY